MTLAQAADPGTAELLIAYTALVITVVGGVLAFLMYHFFPLMRDVDAMKDDLYNGENDDGHIGASEAGREDIRAEIKDLREEVRSEHETVRLRLDDLVLYVDDLGTWMADADALDDPPDYPSRRRARFSGPYREDSGDVESDGGRRRNGRGFRDGDDD